MALVTQLDKDGFVCGFSDDYNGPMPFGCIAQAPPDDELPEHHRWRHVEGEFVPTPDYRGVTVYDEHGLARSLDVWGPLPEGYSLAPPQSKIDETIRASRVRDFENRVQSRLDSFAQSLSYENILTACSYAASNVEGYRIEAQYCLEMRDLTWAKTYKIMGALDEAGPLPLWDEIEAQLPPLAWPEGSRGYNSIGDVNGD